MAIKQKDLDALPVVTGDQFSLLAEGFREYVLACQDEHSDVLETLVDLMGWDAEQAEWVVGALDDGVRHLFPDLAPDPRAEQFRKDTTVVRRKKRG